MADTKAEIERVEKAIAETKSPYLKRDMEKFIKRTQKKLKEKSFAERGLNNAKRTEFKAWSLQAVKGRDGERWKKFAQKDEGAKASS